jgi:vacuolar protein sorting-associated protein 18
MDSTNDTPTPNSDPTSRALLRFLSTAPTDPLTSRPYYDLDYALRLCKRHNRLHACVHIYAQMGLWEESVQTALDMGEVELAKASADGPGDEIDAIEGGLLRRKLWLMIAKYVVQDKKDIKT